MFSPVQAILLVLLMEMYTSFPSRALASLTLWQSLLIEGFLILLPVAMAFGNGRKLVRTLKNHGHLASGVLGKFDQLMSRLRLLACGLLVVNLWVLDFGHLVWTTWGWQRERILAQMIWLLPVLVVWMALWSISHWVHSRDKSNDPQTYNGSREPVAEHPFPSWRAYMAMNLRGNLPFIFLILLADQLLRVAIGSLDSHGLASYSAGISLAAMALMFASLPWLMVRFWSTRPLAKGPLRSELEALAGKWNIRFTDIRIINTFYLVPNAAVLVPGRLARYFLITDLLLETLTHEELLAVFAHEVGHAHHRHVLRYIVALIAIQWIAGALAGLAMNRWPGHDQMFNMLDFSVIGIFFIIGFSRISRMCEHQADWFAARHMAQCLSLTPPPPQGPILITLPEPMAMSEEAVHIPWMLQMDHTDLAPLPQESPPPPLMMGAGVMADALIHLALITQRPVGKPDWMHPSITDRVNLLFRLARSPVEIARFERRMAQLNRLVLAMAVLAILLMILPG